MYTFKEQYETFIGKFFFDKDKNELCRFSDISDNGNAVIIIENFNTVEYSITDALKKIRDNHWIIDKNEN